MFFSVTWSNVAKENPEKEKLHFGSTHFLDVFLMIIFYRDSSPSAGRPNMLASLLIGPAFSQQFHGVFPEKLGGGLKHVLEFSPRTLGKIPILSNLFQMGGPTTNQKRRYEDFFQQTCASYHDGLVSHHQGRVQSPDFFRMFEWQKITLP